MTEFVVTPDEVIKMILVIGTAAETIMEAYPDMGDDMKALIYKCKSETVVEDGRATHKSEYTRITRY